jgi:hypothetical protein
MPVFEKMDPKNIKPEHIRKYMDTQANREKTFISQGSIGATSVAM